MLSLCDLIFQDVDIDIIHSQYIFLYGLICISISCWGYRANLNSNLTALKSIFDKSQDAIQSDETVHHWDVRTCHLSDGYSSASLSFLIDNWTKSNPESLHASAGSLAGGSVKTVIRRRCCCCCCDISDCVDRDHACVLDKMTVL